MVAATGFDFVFDFFVMMNTDLKKLLLLLLRSLFIVAAVAVSAAAAASFIPAGLPLDGTSATAVVVAAAVDLEVQNFMEDGEGKAATQYCTTVL